MKKFSSCLCTNRSCSRNAVLPLLFPLCSLPQKDEPVSLAVCMSLALSCSPPRFLPFCILLCSSDFAQCHHFPLTRRGMGGVYYRSRVSLHGWMAGGASEKKRNLHNFSASFHKNHIAVYLPFPQTSCSSHAPPASHAIDVHYLCSALQPWQQAPYEAKRFPPSHVWSVRAPWQYGEPLP